MAKILPHFQGDFKIAIQVKIKKAGSEYLIASGLIL